jgi:hypothetical protein
LSLIAKNRVEIDPLNRLVGFESRVRLADIPDAIRMQGQVEAGRLNLKVQSGGVVYRPETVVPESAMVGDELSPLAQLPGLRIGQSWTMPVYSPFRAPNSPMEILQASVERHEPITWSGRWVSTKLVVYRSDSGSGLLSGHESRGKLWVSSEPVEGKDGLVLEQEAKIFNSTVHFVRLPRDRGRALVRGLGEDWSSDLSSRRAKELLLKLGRSDP